MATTHSSAGGHARPQVIRLATHNYGEPVAKAPRQRRARGLKGIALQPQDHSDVERSLVSLQAAIAQIKEAIFKGDIAPARKLICRAESEGLTLSYLLLPF